MMISWLNKIGLAALLKKGFPAEVSNDVYKAISHIPIKIHNDVQLLVSESKIYYVLNGTGIDIPDRIYLCAASDERLKKLNEQQKFIYHCLFSRSCDGYIRQKNIEALLAADYPNWAIPYIFKVCDEYVVEILEAVYQKLQPQGSERIRQFCLENVKQFGISYQRMISYWNEYYREKYYKFKHYVGRRLFWECFGYTRSIEKTIQAGREKTK